MNREHFLDKSIFEQISYFNEKLKTGMSISKISKEIGISKSITEKFKKNGYVLQDSQLVCVNPNSIPNNNSNNDERDNESNKTSSFISNEVENIEIPKAKGRPKKRKNSNTHTISMDNDVWKKIRVYGIMNDKDVSEILEQLTIKFLENQNGA